MLADRRVEWTGRRSAVLRLALAGISGVFALGVTGCGGQAAGSAAQDPAAASAAPQPALPSVAAPALRSTPVVTDPTALTLPIQAYMPTDGQLAELTDAQGALAQRCMARLGYSYVPPASASTVSGAVSGMTDLRYGIHDAVTAAADGYHPAAGGGGAAKQAQEIAAANQALARMSPDELYALFGSSASGPVPTTSATKKVPAGGCSGQALGEITGGSPFIADLAQTVNNESYALSLRDPRTLAVFASWSACMKNAGYDYANPNAAVNDPRFQGGTPSALQKATAVADVRCKDQGNVIGVWYSVDTAYQVSLIKKNSRSFQAIGQQDTAEVRNASRLVG